MFSNGKRIIYKKLQIHSENMYKTDWKLQEQVQRVI